MKKPNRTFLRKKGKTNKHHNKSKSRGGTRAVNNLILLDENRHASFHLLFQNRDFLEAAQVLIRTHNMKNGTKYRLVQWGDWYGIYYIDIINLPFHILSQRFKEH